jgi:hypothetical protein
MARHRQYLCAFYAVVATVALIATWGQNLAYFHGIGSPAAFLGAFTTFVLETWANPATRSITVDLLLLCLAGMTFMILEARRLGIRFVWAYIVLGFLVAISVTFPLFMIARERHLAWHEGGGEGDGEAAPLALADGLGLAVLTATVVGLCVFILAG